MVLKQANYWRISNNTKLTMIHNRYEGDSGLAIV